MNGEIIDRLKNIEKMLRMLLVREDLEPKSAESPAAAKTSAPWKNNEYMKPDDIAKELGVNVITIRRWLRDGEIPYTKFGRSIRIKTKDFEKYINDNYVD